ncbi:MAG: hypothetical protein QNI97_15410 [Desulfobacterales bacterium]|nr:hypothetical protein [Desulfobacterales bacterium]MDJ0856120.1 hypothetical protein [Desulfobacterales bacterium]MDJ0991037.1 hypothetical protein [Desulfobacterales bacterium]
MLARFGRVHPASLYLALFMTVVLGACRSTPAPIIVGDTYTNIQYEYSLKIPRGWEPVAAFPEKMKYFGSLADVDKCSLLLYNEASGGLIAIMNSTNRIAYDEYFDISGEQWKKILLKMKGALEEDLEEVVFQHEVQTENLYTTQQNYFVNQYAYKPERIYRIESSFTVDAQRVHLNFDSFLFPCRNTRSCEAIIILTCPDETLVENQSAYQEVLLSLRAHDYYE